MTMLNEVEKGLLLSLVNQEIEDIKTMSFDNKKDQQEMMLYLCDLELIRCKLEG